MRTREEAEEAIRLIESGISGRNSVAFMAAASAIRWMLADGSDKAIPTENMIVGMRQFQDSRAAHERN